MMRKIWLILLSVSSILPCLQAQTAHDEIIADVHRSASNYYAYPNPSGKLTPAPAGYKPFYISQYARHGSRYLIDPGQYERPLNTLRKADEEGKLTPLGKRTLAILDSVSRMAKDRYGELTALGARQHRGIAKRLFERYPEVFTGNTFIDARSTPVVRCILSMTAECLQLQSANAKLRFRNDASHYDQYYMNYDSKRINKYENTKQSDSAYNVLKRKHFHADRLMASLLNDTAYTAQNVKAGRLIDDLFDVAGNMQSLDTQFNLFPLFTKEECYDLWLLNNYSWYTGYGPSPYTSGIMPYREANLLENFLNTADTCVVQHHPNVTLRFGHEVCVLPFACLLELGDCGFQTKNPEEVDAHWRNYRIFPMASNIQWVFYRKSGSQDILVKILLNEEEMTLPVKSNVAPYYHWADVSKYYRHKLAVAKASPLYK